MTKSANGVSAPRVVVYYLNVEVTFKKPLHLLDEKNVIKKRNAVIGFMQDVGCTATSEREMKDLVLSSILSDYERKTSTVVFDRIGEIQKSDLQKEIYEDTDIAGALLGNPVERGVWYKSGRGYFY